MKFTALNISKENTWQIGTGDGTRMYLDVFLNFGVALVGPGDPGMEGYHSTEEFYERHKGRRNWGAVLKQVEKGEWMIAKKGKRYIVALGQVVDEYNYSEIFNDVEGWDLQHYIKVNWYIPKTDNGQLTLPPSVHLSQSTLQRCQIDDVYNIIYETEFEEYSSKRSIGLISERKLQITDIVNSLVEEGLRIQDADNIGTTLQRIIRLTNYYTNYHYNVSEAEIIAFLIAPTLIALGWSEQKIKFQISNIDIAVYEEAYVEDYEQSPSIIIEAKAFQNGLAFTDNQIKKYASYFPECKKFIATNGFRYRYFEKKQDDKLILRGAFNIMKLKERDVLRDLPLTSIETIFSISKLK